MTPEGIWVCVRSACGRATRRSRVHLVVSCPQTSGDCESSPKHHVPWAAMTPAERLRLLEDDLSELAVEALVAEGKHELSSKRTEWHQLMEAIRNG